MFTRIRRFIVVPACLLVAAPFIAFSAITKSNSPNITLPRIRPLSFEQLAALFGWCQLNINRPDIAGPTGLNAAGLLFSPPTLDRPLLPSTFRGAIRRQADNWRFDQVLGRHEIELKSDPCERINIQLAAEAVDGLVMMPGGTFSFNHEVGVRSEERGYKPGLMFQQGQVIRGIGGGICVVSTGLYNAALKAGLQIVDRSSHSGIPRYAGPGFDSAVAYGLLDLKIKNDKFTPVLIRSTVRDGVLVVTLLGRKKPGVEVILVTEGRKEIPYKIFEKPDPSVPEGEVVVRQAARPGLEIVTVRVIKENGRTIKREVVDRSRYLPRHKIILIPMPEEEAAAGQPVEPAEPVTSDQ